jgi:hypothetical protein
VAAAAAHRWIVLLAHRYEALEQRQKRMLLGFSAV